MKIVRATFVYSQIPWKAHFFRDIERHIIKSNMGIIYLLSSQIGSVVTTLLSNKHPNVRTFIFIMLMEFNNWKQFLTPSSSSTIELCSELTKN